jgi:hypothetical protein
MEELFSDSAVVEHPVAADETIASDPARRRSERNRFMDQ